MKQELKLLKKTLRLPVTSNWILGGLLVALFFSVLKILDPLAFISIGFFELWIIFVYDLLAALILNTHLTKGTCTIPKWTKFAFIYCYIPMLLANAYLSVNINSYLIVTIATLYAGFLGVVGIFEKRFFLYGGGVYVFFYLIISFYKNGINDLSWIQNSIVFSSFSFISLYWLSLASHFVLSQNRTIQKLLRQSRKDKRALGDEREKIKNLIDRLNHSFSLIKRDLNTAKKIQERILPGSLEFKNYSLDIYSKYFPMNEVGGDFYDICKVSDNKYRFFLADATGHGVQGALITMLIKVEYEFVKFQIEKPSQLLESLNRDFFRQFKSLNMYYTCILVDIDLEEKLFSYASAGHPDQIFIHKDEIQLLSRTGRMIGLSEDAMYGNQICSFDDRDKFFLFSDGLFEQFDNARNQFGEERLHAILSSRKHKSVSETIEICLDKMYTHLDGAEIQDDITTIGIEFRPR